MRILVVEDEKDLRNIITVSYTHLDVYKRQWLACSLPVAFVILQAVLFARGAYKSGKKLGLNDKQMKKAMKSSAVTSIGPSIVVLSAMLSLLVSVGGLSLIHI